MTLTETATITKRALRVLLVVGSGFLVLWIAFLIIYNQVIVPYQRSQIKPEEKFGKLPAPKLPATLLSSALTYSLDTPSGNLPAGIPKLISVYFLPPLETGLLSPDRARQLAANLGFKNGPDIISATNYRFQDPNGGVMVIDLSTSNFSYKRVPPAQPDQTPQNETLPTEDKITTDFRAYLSRAGLIKPDFEAGVSKVVFDKTSNKDSTTATVSIWPADIDKLKIVTANPDIGLVNSTVTKYTDVVFKYPNLNYTYWPVDKESFSTYPLRPISEAFADLEQGRGTVVKNNPQGDKTSLTRIYLAYFMSAEYSSFLQPVYVFESDNFSAYVPALAAESYTQ